LNLVYVAGRIPAWEGTNGVETKVPPFPQERVQVLTTPVAMPHVSDFSVKLTIFSQVHEI